MADQQIEDLADLGSNLAAGDQFICNDVSDLSDDSGGSPKRISADNIRLFMAGSLLLDAEFNAGLGNVAKTLIVGRITPVDLGANNGGTLAANVVITLPASPAVGDVTGFFITRASNQAGSFAQAPGYGAELANATRINDVAYTSASTGTGKWGLWLPGELLIFRYLDTGFGSGTAGWYVQRNGKIPVVLSVHLNTSTTGTYMAVANTFYDIKFDTVDVDNLNGWKSSTWEAQIKRAGNYMINSSALPATASVNELITMRGWNGTTQYVWGYGNCANAANATSSAIGSDVAVLPANTNVRFQIRRSGGTGEILGSAAPATSASIIEIP